MNGLIEHLMRTHGINRERAEMRAKYIVAKQAERAAAKKIKLAQAQTLLPFDGEADEEPVSKYEPTEDVPF